MRASIIFYVVVGTTLFGVVTLYSFVSRPEAVSQTDPVLLEIGQLSAAGPVDRRTAEDRIIQIGAPAIQPLIAALEDLMRHPRNRYAIGTTESDFIDTRERAERIHRSDANRHREDA